MTPETSATTRQGPGIEGDPQLILGKRQGSREIEAVVVDLHQNLFTDLRSICARFLQRLTNTAPRGYEPNAEIDRDNEHFVLDIDEVPEQPPASSRRRSTEEVENENMDRTAALVRTLRSPGRLEQIDASSLKEFKALFYSISYQQPDLSWAHFIRKVNPRQLLKPGFLWTHYGSSLKRIATPDMVIESNVDVLLMPEQLFSFNGNTIKDLFTDVHLAAQNVPNYVDSIVAALGEDVRITDEALDVLRRTAMKKVSFARRLFALQSTLTSVHIKLDMIRDALASHGIEQEQLLDGEGNLRFEENAVGVFLDVMEERYFESDWTQESRRADRFSTRRRS